MIKDVLRQVFFAFPQVLDGFTRMNRNRRLLELMARNADKIEVMENRAALHDRIGGLVDNGPLDYFEFGVYSGKSFLPWMTRNQHADSRFFGFDTFTGLPETWDENRPAGAFDAKGRFPDTGDDTRAEFHAGIFQHSLHPFLNSWSRQDGRKLVMHIDCDIFTGAIYSLFAMEPFLRDGDYVLFDEFKDHNNEFRAWEIFCDSTDLTLEPVMRTAKNNQWAFVMRRPAAG